MISSFFKIIIFITIFYITNLYTKATFANIVVVSYENFNETNFNVETIKNHIEVLTKEKYFIFSTNSIIGLLNKSETLPDYSVAITIASNKKQIINYIWPILAKASIPFTLFIDPYIINKNDNSNLEKATNILNILKKHNLDVLIDDTDENISSKIKKFNLLGIPFQIIIGKNFNEQKIEFKEVFKDTLFISLDEIIKTIKNKKSN